MTPPLTAPSAPRTYGNWARPASPGLWGLGSLGTGLLISTPALAVLASLINLTAAVSIAALGVFAIAPLAVRFGSRTLGELLMVRLAYRRARRRNEHLYFSGALAKPYGQHRLPGLLATSRLVDTRDGLDRPAGIVIIPSTGHYTAVLRLDPEGAALVDQDQIDQWVAGYGLWLAQLAHEPGFTAATITIETAPDPGTRLATAVGAHRASDAPPLAHQVLDTIVDSYPAGSPQVTAWATLTYRSTGTRRRDTESMINHVATRIPVLVDALRGTGAGAVRPMPATDIADIVRTAYDPAVGATIEHLRATGQPTGITWSNAGPKAHLAGWDSYRHDSGISRTYSMDEAPRGTVLAGILKHLLEDHERLTRKRVTLTYRPHTPADAARIVDRDVRTAVFNQDARGRARDRTRIRAAEQAAAEEATGAGVVDLSLLVAVTVDTATDLADADTILNGLAGTARLQLRPTYAGQPAAFAATLPTGIVLPEHVAIPTAIRKSL